MDAAAVRGEPYFGAMIGSMRGPRLAIVLTLGVASRVPCRGFPS